ncbi:MAG: hypothetical protein GEV06_25490 [Luteitalea sp.]|nr:hypothetical protein [Luteitalea sp.]
MTNVGSQGALRPLVIHLTDHKGTFIRLDVQVTEQQYEQIRAGVMRVIAIDDPTDVRPQASDYPAKLGD